MVIGPHPSEILAVHSCTSWTFVYISACFACCLLSQHVLEHLEGGKVHWDRVECDRLWEDSIYTAMGNCHHARV